MRPLSPILLLCVLATACSDASGPAGDVRPPEVLRAAWPADTLWIARTARAVDLLIEVSDSSGIAGVTAFLTMAGAPTERTCTAADTAWRCRVAILPAQAGSTITLDSVRAVDLAGNVTIRPTTSFLRLIPHPKLAECRANVVDLAPGEIHYFAGAVGCVTIARGGEYAAAVFDTRAVDRAGIFGPIPGNAGLSGTIAGIASPFHGLGNTEPGDALAHARHLSDVHQVSDEEFCGESPGLIICREAEFTIGEDIDVQVHSTLKYRARVVSKYGFITYAVELDDLPQWTPEWIAAFDAATEQHLRYTIPLLRETLHPGDGSTTRAGELLILLRRGEGPSHVNRWTRPGFSRALAVILMHNPLPNNTLLISILGHELAHVWQGLHSATAVGSGVLWGLEGGATFLETEAARRMGGFSFDGNYTSDELFATEAGRDYLNLFAGQGRLQRGYFDAAMYMRGLWHQCMRAGQSEDVCRSEIARGVQEDWRNHTPGLGLTPRMQKLLGASWDPVRSVLEWALAMSADDRTSHPAMQIPSVHNAWEETLFESSGLRMVGDTVGVSGNLVLGAALHFRMFAASGELIDLLPRRSHVRWALVRLH